MRRKTSTIESRLHFRPSCWHREWTLIDRICIYSTCTIEVHGNDRNSVTRRSPRLNSSHPYLFMVLYFIHVYNSNFTFLTGSKP
ncbi:hypothetical protein BDV36DRAFT_249110 [Aspergillus pseudocaelatus]|uniref:Uncharacterized protein n=1 Tax=Aspergillus pseudocaelatus TaxID=1825620 RepID=A0ABQ6WUJ0_9EURO|nr:hypothetical protein BDV36DRAFT_249110 [Aspergillus pseudocaelatus]